TGLYAVAPRAADGSPGNGTGTRNFLTRAMSELQAIPGIQGVALAELTPFGGLTRSAITGDQPARVVHFNRTGPEYFATIGLRVLAGRTFTREETATRAPVALISRPLA